MSFVPSMFQIGIGLSLMYMMIVNLKVRAAYKLDKVGVSQDFVMKWRIAIGHAPTKTEPTSEVQKNPKLVIRVLKGALARVKSLRAGRSSNLALNKKNDGAESMQIDSVTRNSKDML